MGRLKDDFVKAGVHVLIIIGEPLERARRYAESLKIPFPVLADPERTIYHKFELQKNFIGIQHTASVLVDPNGVISYIKRAMNPMTWLQESKELIDIAKTLA